MSEPHPPQRHLDASQGREVVYCHACQNEWHRDEQPTLECPRCHGEITEIVSPENDPRNLEDGPDLSFGRRPPVFDNYHESDSDPEEADIDQHIHPTGNGFFMHRTIRPGGAANHDDPEVAVLRRFTDMLNDFNGGPPGRAGQPPSFPQMPGGDNPNGPRGASPAPAFTRTTFRASPFGTTTVTISTIGGAPGGRGGPLDFDTVFGNLVNGMGPPPGRIDPNNPQARQGQQPAPPFAASLHGLIAMILGHPPGGVHGDAVYSQEALDRIITQLMEANPQSNAAPPASEDAIAKLPKRKVELEDLGSDGKAECTICIDEMNVGDEVTVLPCKHWFHGECVTLWLKEHNTCPICRTPIEPNRRNNRQAGRQQQGQQQDQQQGQQPGQQQGDQQGHQPGQQQGQQQSNQQPNQPQPNQPFGFFFTNLNPNMQQPNQQQQTPNQDPAPSNSNSRSRYDRLFRTQSTNEDRLNAIRNLGGASYRPSPSRTSSSSQQQGTSQRRSSHSPPAEPETRTPRVRSPSTRSRDPFEDEQQQDRQRQFMSGYESDPFRRMERSSEGGRERSRDGERHGSGPLNWLRDQWTRHSGSGGGGGNGSGSGSGSGSGDKRRS